MEERLQHEEILQYEAPTIVDYGRLRELTAGQTTGSHLDKSFPSGTDNSQLTFSFPPHG